MEFADDGEVYLGMMPGSLKALDLRRDARFALHCPTQDPPEGDVGAWLGDGKIAGTAVEVLDDAAPGEGHRFRLDIDEVVLTTVAPTGDHLVLLSWHPDRGLERRTRR